MTDRAGLAGRATAVDIDADIVLAERVGEHEGRADDHLQSLETKVIVNVTLVDRDVAGAGEQPNAGDGFFTSAGAKILCHSHVRFLLNYLSTSVSGFCAALLCSGPA